MVSREEVIESTRRIRQLYNPERTTFFEFTTAVAFDCIERRAPRTTGHLDEAKTMIGKPRLVDFRALAFERLPRFMDKLDAFLTKNEIVRARMEGVGVLSPAKAVAYGCTGPLLRASGVPYDVRRAEPYSIYDRFDFDIVTGKNGDAYDRYLVRVGEMRQSLRILQQALEQLPDGPIMAGRSKPTVKIPAGEAYGRIESPKGELGFYLVSDGSGNPYRYHIRAPSFINLATMNEMCRGHLVADVVIILASIDITLGEVDR